LAASATKLYGEVAVNPPAQPEEYKMIWFEMKI
jgi:hypothetical protein